MRRRTPTPPNLGLMEYRVRASRYLDQVSRILAGDPALAAQKLVKLADTVRRSAVRAGQLAQTHARNELERIMGKAVARNVASDRAVLEAFVEEQVRLFQKLALDVSNALASQGALAALKVAENRARLISSDQVFKVFAESLSYYAIQSGSPGYYWQTREDERVRPKHRAAHGKRFKWNDPPAVGREGQKLHPGQDIHCRCSTIPVIPRQA